MVLTRWSPWHGLFDAQREMDQLFRRVFDSASMLTPYQPGTRALGSGWTPAVDVFHREGDLVIRAELPGVNPEEDVEIYLRDNVLTVKGERRQEARHENGGTSRFESAYGAFERSVVLPQGVNPEDITATYENGILEVVVPGVAQLTAGKRIPIQAGSGRHALTTKGEKTTN